MFDIKRSLLVAVLVLTAVAAQPLALAHEGEHGVHLTLEAGEGDACPEDDNFCFDVVEGDLADVTPGADVELTIENPSDNGIQHNANVADLADADKGGDTSSSAAYASTDDVAPGETDTVNFTVPDDVDGTYIWCDIGAHEAGGMWLETSGDGGGGDGADGANGSPGFTAPAVLAAAGLALGLARRNRT